jgi:iron(III) transport system ATP-binding protein
VSGIQLEGVSKAYGRHAVVRDMTIAIRDGECFTFLGPSGCGKTVVLRLIAGFERPDAGEIRIGDSVVFSAAARTFVPPERRRIGVVFQDYAVWPHKTVYENVAYPLEIGKVPGGQLRERTMAALAQVNLQALATRLPFQLSGGQQQRVALARALVSEPAVMLLDEPLSNLDANLREEMRFELKDIQRRTGVTILYVTHDQEVALAISDRVAVMDGEGTIRQSGTPTEIYERPSDAFVFQFMGVCNFIPVRVRDGAAYVAGSDAPLELSSAVARPRAAGDAIAGCRLSDVRLAPPGNGPRGVLKRAIFLGSMMEYRVALGGAEIRIQEETRASLARGVLREGDAVGVAFADLKWFAHDEVVLRGGGGA